MEVNERKTLDPTELFPMEIVEKIFFNLRARDLIYCTFVSPNWNRLVGCSAKCMDKFVLRLEYTENHVKPISSDRRYQQINLSGDVSEKNFNSIYKVMSSKTWKLVVMDWITFESTSSLVKMIETFEGTVEKFEIHQVKVVNRDIEVQGFEFKRLRHLVYFSFDDVLKAPLDLFKNCSSLQSICFECSELQCVKMFVRILQRQKNLKRLFAFFNLPVQTVDAFYTFPFKLEELMLINIPNATTRKLALSLLHNQEKIKRLALEFMNCSLFLNAALGLKSLVEISFQDQWSYFQPPFTLNETIQILRINGEVKNDQVTRLLIALPNVKHAKLLNVDDELAHFIAENMKKLEILTSYEIDIESVQSILPAVKIHKIQKSAANRLINWDPEIKIRF